MYVVHMPHEGELAHLTMKAEKSHDVCAGAQESQTVWSQAKPQSPRPRNTHVQGQDIPAQAERDRERTYLSSAFFVLFGPLWGWMTPTGSGEGYFLPSVYPDERPPPALTGAPGKNVLPDIWASLRPVKVTRGISHHSPAGKWQSQAPT